MSHQLQLCNQSEKGQLVTFNRNYQAQGSRGENEIKRKGDTTHPPPKKRILGTGYQVGIHQQDQGGRERPPREPKPPPQGGQVTQE